MSLVCRAAFPWEFAGDRESWRAELPWSCPPPRPLDAPRTTNDDYWMTLDPSRRRQLSDMAVLWRGAAGERAGLVLSVGVDVSESPVGAVAELEVVRIGGDAVAVSSGERGLEVMLAGRGLAGCTRVSRTPCSLLVDLALGEVRPSAWGPFDAEIASWIAGELDGELLDHLHRASISFGGFDPGDRCRLDVLRDWKPGALVPYSWAYPRSRIDAFRIDDRIGYVDDLHCPVPACTCRTVFVNVYVRGPEGAAADLIGRARLAPPFEEVELGPLRPENEALLLAILARYRARYPRAERFEDRRRCLSVVGALLLERNTPRLVARRLPGRNAPCHCGSGKKHKACCLGRA